MLASKRIRRQYYLFDTEGFVSVQNIKQFPQDILCSA